MDDFGDLSFPLGDGALLVAELVKLLLQDPLLALEALAVLRALNQNLKKKIDVNNHLTTSDWLIHGGGARGGVYPFEFGQDAFGLFEEELLLALVGPPRLDDDLFVLNGALLARLFQLLLQQTRLQRQKQIIQ